MSAGKSPYLNHEIDCVTSDAYALHAQIDLIYDIAYDTENDGDDADAAINRIKLLARVASRFAGMHAEQLNNVQIKVQKAEKEQ